MSEPRNFSIIYWTHIIISYSISYHFVSERRTSIWMLLGSSSGRLRGLHCKQSLYLFCHGLLSQTTSVHLNSNDQLALFMWTRAHNLLLDWALDHKIWKTDVNFCALPCQAMLTKLKDRNYLNGWLFGNSSCCWIGFISDCCIDFKGSRPYRWFSLKSRIIFDSSQ